MGENICRFIPFRQNANAIHTINFVLETQAQKFTQLKAESTYKIHYVCEGNGIIHTADKEFALTKGDVFFTFPAHLYAIESVKDFSFMYISFVGNRGNRIMESLKINSGNFIFHDAEEIYGFWQNGILTNPKVSDLISESVLLYTFAFLGDRLLDVEPEKKQLTSAELFKKYIDEHFSDPDFSLDDIERDLSYNKKYVSHVFKKYFGIGSSQYLNTIRIQNACTLMNQGFTSVGGIAFKCGFSDAQYFSKVFKNQMDISPTQYITWVRNKNK